MNRPLPDTLSVWVPPVPVVVEKIEVQVVPSLEVWIWNALPNAVSQCSVTWQMDCAEPRSTCSHCGSENALDQRVPWLPSTAFAAGKEAFSIEEAVAGRFSAMLVVPQVPAAAGAAPGTRIAASARGPAARASAHTRRVTHPNRAAERIARSMTPP